MGCRAAQTQGIRLRHLQHHSPFDLLTLSLSPIRPHLHPSSPPCLSPRRPQRLRRHLTAGPARLLPAIAIHSSLSSVYSTCVSLGDFNCCLYDHFSAKRGPFSRCSNLASTFLPLRCIQGQAHRLASRSFWRLVEIWYLVSSSSQLDSHRVGNPVCPFNILPVPQFLPAASSTSLLPIMSRP